MDSVEADLGASVELSSGCGAESLSGLGLLSHTERRYAATVGLFMHQVSHKRL